jgi:integrase
MRIGEVLALSWRDVDLDKGIVTVSRTLTTNAKGQHKIGEIPKTRASRRSILIGAATIAALRRERAKQAARRLLLGPDWHDQGLVFDRGDGQPINPDVVRTSFERVLRKNPSLPTITLHGMRHTMATLLLTAGMNPKIVQERLGHSSIQMTLDRYSHVTLSMQESAATILDTLLSGEARPNRGQELG